MRIERLHPHSLPTLAFITSGCLAVWSACMATCLVSLLLTTLSLKSSCVLIYGGRVEEGTTPPPGLFWRSQ